MKNIKWKRVIVLALIIFALYRFVIILTTEDTKDISYVEFQNLVEEEQVESVTIDRHSEMMRVVGVDDIVYRTPSPNHEGFKKELLESDIAVTVKDSSQSPNLINILFYALIFYVIYKLITNQTGGKSKKIDFPVNMPKTKFNDIAGYAEQKEDLTTYVSYLKDPKSFSKQGANMPKGVLLYGPPGTGKTLFARAIAGEAGVPFFSVGGSDFIEMYVGVGAKRVRNLFQNARKFAPCIIFIDEIDAVGGSRDHSGSSNEHRQTLNALLQEMDGFDKDSGVLVLATTNRPNELDVHAKERKFAEDVDLHGYAKQWVGFSGADIESVLNESAIIAVQKGLEKITKDCLDDAFYKKVLKGHIKKDGQKERKEEEVRLVAFHEAGHAVTRKLLNNGEVSKVTILSTTNGAGGVTFNVPEKMGLFTMEELHHEIKTLYAGRAAEYLMNGKQNHKVTTGASNDIERATKILHSMIAQYGLQEEPVLLNFKLLRNGQQYTMDKMTELSKQLFDETVQLLEDNYTLLEEVADRLIGKETIESEELNLMVEEYLKKQTDKQIQIA